MEPRRSSGSDEDNASFDLPEAALEELRPGMEYGEAERAGAAERRAGEAHDRRVRRDLEEIPQRSLAERVRQATKGG